MAMTIKTLFRALVVAGSMMKGVRGSGFARGLSAAAVFSLARAWDWPASSSSLRASSPQQEQQQRSRFLHGGEDSLQEGVISLLVFDEDRDLDLISLYEGTVVNMDSLGSQNLNIRATTHGESIVSVSFVWNHIEEISYDNSGDNFFTIGSRTDFVLQPGDHTITATAHSDIKGRGTAYPSVVSVSFTVVSSASSAKNVPVLLGGWDEFTEFPVKLAEGQGAIMGTTFLMVGGFHMGGGFITRPNVYTLDMTDSTADWIEKNPIPIDPEYGLSHSGFTTVGDNLFYMCGGYFGVNPGPHKDNCYVYDLAADVWEELPSLPAGRGGGGMVYIESKNALLFSMGAERPVGGPTYDKTDTWMLELDKEDGWVTKTDSPFHSNHLAYVSAMDCDEEEHIFFVGGQIEEKEHNENVADHYEYLPDSDEWVKRASMVQGRGHMSSSTRAYSCGYIIVAGAIDSGSDAVGQRTADISYYDIPTDTWTRIGDYMKTTLTPVCDIFNDYLYCTTGMRPEGWKRALDFSIDEDDDEEIPSPAPSQWDIGVAGGPVATLPPTPQPTPQPTAAPTPQPTAAPTSSPTYPPTRVPTSGPTTFPTASPTAVPTVYPTAPPTPAPTETVVVVGATYMYVNCGGSSDFTDDSGRTWLADQPYVNGGRTRNRWLRTFDTGSYDQILFKTDRAERDNQPLVYTLPVSSGSYELELMFAESANKRRPGTRLFDIYVNGQERVSNYDIFEEAGDRFKAVSLFLDVVVETGELVIEFDGIVAEGKINAIAVRPGGQ